MQFKSELHRNFSFVTRKVISLWQTQLPIRYTEAIIALCLPMSVAKDLEPFNLEPQDVRFPPGDLDSDEPPLESELHLRQILLLIQSLEWLW